MTPDTTALLDPSFDEPEALARVLEAHRDYRVLRRLQPKTDFGRKAKGADVIKVAILDTETTGLDATRDQIIELALILVDVDAQSGQPIKVTHVYDELEDPGRPIPAEAVKVTGITDDMVAGKRLNDELIADLISGVGLVIAHNARFDRGFVERRLPAFTALPWACSVTEINWGAEGRGSAKLEFLAHELGWFYDAHRAEMDCHALLAVLSQPLPVSGVTGLKRLLDGAQQTRYRVFATGSPFDSKDALKSRGYRWDADRKVWHTQLDSPEAVDAEAAWLKDAVYKGRSASIELEALTALERFSVRSGQLVQRVL
ncbi:MAG TPA: 3'-5' exonuclease [Aquabacterium sp.]|nr:3'-5' exonuclease [Aquabacterium sp.]